MWISTPQVYFKNVFKLWCLNKRENSLCSLYPSESQDFSETQCIFFVSLLCVYCVIFDHFLPIKYRSVTIVYTLLWTYRMTNISAFHTAADRHKDVSYKWLWPDSSVPAWSWGIMGLRGFFFFQPSAPTLLGCGSWGWLRALVCLGRSDGGISGPGLWCTC